MYGEEDFYGENTDETEDYRETYPDFDYPDTEDEDISDETDISEIFGISDGEFDYIGNGKDYSDITEKDPSEIFTEKQAEYIRHKPKRWNIKTGAMRSGKTFCDLYVIPMRIAGLKTKGLVVFIGATVGTLCRNIINPMREIWGEAVVGYPHSDCTVSIFGRRCYLIGASRADQVDKLRGMSIAYAYGDEVTTWGEEVFDMLKSRLDRNGSVFDGTCNPEGPNHWFRRFIESGADVFHQHYVIDDNPALDRAFVENLKREYEGTVLYDRYILGKWTAGKGAVYPVFAASPNDFTREAPEGLPTVMGIDFGGTGSATAFVACSLDGENGTVYVIRSELIVGAVDCQALCGAFDDFYREIGSPPCSVYCDSAEPILIRSLRRYAWDNGLEVSFRNARKGLIANRIVCVNTLISHRRLFLSEDAKTLRRALESAVWKNGGEETEVRRDDGTSDIDTLDAFEYCIEKMRIF